MNAWKSSPCIPWSYLKDGCWARAHFGWNLSKSMNFELNKICVDWTEEGKRNKEYLRAGEDNYEWGNHVALYKIINEITYVVDGSLFDVPVKVEEWKEKLGFDDKYHKITLLSGRRYGLIINKPFIPEFDDNLVKTNSTLAMYWENFKNSGGYLPSDETWVKCNFPR